MATGQNTKHNARFQDRTGTTIHALHVDSYAGYTRGYSLWLCTCQCGTQRVFTSAYLNQAKDHASCGCLRKLKAPVTINCAHCKQPFTAKHHKARTAKFCSILCQHAHNVGKKRHVAKLPVLLTCPNCQKTFSVTACTAKERKYCSRLCRQTHKTAQIERSCLRCSKKFFKYQSAVKLGAGLYCSRLCWRLHRANVFHLVLCRGKCEQCGFDKEPMILTIHHKDRNRENNTLENLELLCWNCHMIEHLNAKDGPYHNTGNENSRLKVALKNLAKAISEAAAVEPNSKA